MTERAGSLPGVGLRWLCRRWLLPEVCTLCPRRLFQVLVGALARLRHLEAVFRKSWKRTPGTVLPRSLMSLNASREPRSSDASATGDKEDLIYDKYQSRACFSQDSLSHTVLQSGLKRGLKPDSLGLNTTSSAACHATWWHVMSSFSSLCLCFLI